ncbi:MLP-like protein 328 [Prunus yedoensis var. nudiflora]|uniref:MLP-like protein 328 n=1 Tax=Prunus yedoensis var. nudiflora TaxID=2094558 RepID=A0A314ZH27_PRUYE|nr:MLP-like protein 328 [Prunus yedoensis var. nudiflora]
MALHGFIGTQIELKSPADKFYKIFKGQAHLIPNVSSGHIKGVQGDVSVANLTIHYEKRNADVEAPDRYVGVMVTLIRDLDAHFANA